MLLLLVSLMVFLGITALEKAQKARELRAEETYKQTLKSKGMKSKYDT